MEVRKTTRVRRLLQAVRYDLRPDIPSVPCNAEGNPRVTSFVVSLYKTVGDNVPLLHRTTKLRYRRKESSGRWTAWVDKQDSEAITVPTGLYVQYEIEAYYGGALLTSLGVSTTLDGGMGNKGAQSRTRVWSPNDSYMQGQGTEIWYDISLYREDDTKPYERYLCLISHGPRNITPKDDVAQGLGYWASATEYEFIATRLALAERIKANQIDANGITAKDVDISGKITATSGSFTGNVTATSGEIGGFTIEPGYMYAEKTQANGIDKDRMQLNPQSIEFSSTQSNLNIKAAFGASGSGILHPILGLNIPISVKSEVTTSYSPIPNIGLYVSCSGAMRDDGDAGVGNHSLYIPKGHICGFRMQTRRISSSTTLSVLDSVILATRADINLTLPTSDVEDGQIYFIRNHTNGKVYVKGRISNKGYPNSDYKTVGIAAGDLNVYIYDAVNNVWTYNYAIRDK